MQKLTLAAAILASAPALSAEPISYTYVEISGFERTAEWETGIAGADDEVEGDGYGIKGSFRTEEGALFQASYYDGEIDNAWGITPSSVGGEIDYRKFGVMVGGANPVNAKTSVWGGIGFDREELDGRVDGIGSSSWDVDEWYLAMGARHAVTSMLELNGGARVIHFRADETELFNDYRDTDIELNIGIRLQPVQWLSIGASYARQLDLEMEFVKADLRFQF